MKEYKGTKEEYDKDKYKPIKQEFANDLVAIKLYCDKPKCYNYIKGVLGYNGSFISESNEQVDLRNQVFVCSKCKEEKNE